MLLYHIFAQHSSYTLTAPAFIKGMEQIITDLFQRNLISSDDKRCPLRAKLQLYGANSMIFTFENSFEIVVLYDFHLT